MLKTYVAAQARLAALKAWVAGLGRDEDGAALIEYTLLIGMIAIGIVAAIGAIGLKLGGDWTGFKTKIGA